MHSVRTSPKPLLINGIAGEARINKVGIKKGFGKCYVHPAFPVTILSLGGIEHHGCKVKYETDETTVDGAQCMHVTTPEGETYLFKRSPGTTLYVWKEPRTVSSFPVTTVAEKKSQYTLREIKQADDANDFMASMLWPSKELAKQMCRASVLTGNPVGTKDIDIAYDIYGKPLELEKGARTKQHSHKHVVLQELEPQPNRKTDLWLDIFYINKILMLTAVAYLSGCDRPLLLVRHMTSKKAEVLFDGCKAIIGNLRKYNVTVDKISIDRESAMNPVEPLLSNEGYKVNMMPDHVVQAERNGRTIKEGVRKIQSSVKFPLFGALIVFTVYFVVSRLNMWPNPKRPEQPTPIENLTLTKRSFSQEAYGPCLTYVRVDAKPGETDNSLDDRALEGLYLYPTPNQTGESTVFNLNTGRNISRRLKPSDKAPMPQYIIDRLRASAAKHAQDLVFSTHRGVLADLEDEGQAAAIDEAERAALLQPVPAPEPIVDPPHDLHIDPIIESTQTKPAPMPVQSDYRSESDALIDSGVISGDSADRSSTILDTILDTAEVESYERRSTRLSAKPRKQWRSKDVGIIYSLHISMSKALRKHGKEGVRALTKEIQQIDDLGTFKGVHLTPALRRKAIMSLLFFKEKYLSTGQFDKLKARLVAGGHQQDRTVYDGKDVSSPTVATECVYIVAGIAALERRKVITVDIAGAYLKGSFKENAEPIHMRLDAKVAEALCVVNPGYEVYKLSDGSMYVELLKPLYGLIEAAQLWYTNITTTLSDAGFVQNSYDKCVWNRMFGDDQQTIVIHVDDLKITCKNEEANKDIVRVLREKYKDVTVNEGMVHSYIGITFDYSTAGKVLLTQEGYTGDLILCYEIKSSVKTPAGDDLFTIDTSSPLLGSERAEEFHTLSAKLLYLSMRTRPDIQVAVSFLTSRVQCATEQDAKKATRVLRYLFGTQHLGIVIEPDESLFCVRSYIDASYGVHADGRSHTGVTISLGKGPVMSKSTKQKITTKSSTEAELIALSDASSLVIWTRNFLEEQGYKMPPAKIFQDNTSTIAMIKAGMPTSDRTRHIAIRFFFVKDRVDAGELDISYVSTKDMQADILTKPLQGELFLKLRKELLNYE